MRYAVILLTVLLGVTSTFAEDKPATQPADSTTIIKADDADAIKANMDKDVAVEGTIDKAEWSGSGKVMRASFKEGAETKIIAVIFVKDREKFDQAFSGDVCKALTGAKVRVKGKLKEFRSAPEIVLDDVNQVTVVDAAPAQ